MTKQHLSQDSILRNVIESVDLPEISNREDVYLNLIRAIVGQQLSTKVARVIFDRFLNLFEDQYPHHELLLSLPIETLRSAGLSQGKSHYIQNIARFAQEQGLSRELLEPLSDEEIIKYLTQIKGVGKWTVEMLLMFTLQRPDVFPIDDLGIQQAMVALYLLEEKGKDLKKKMVEIAEPWRPYRTLACRYLWTWKNNNP